MTVPTWFKPFERLRTPTKYRVGNRDPMPVVRKFLYDHAQHPPSDWWKVDQLPDLSYLFPSLKYHPVHCNDVNSLMPYNGPASPGLYLRAKGYPTQRSVYDDHDAYTNHVRNPIHLVKLGRCVSFTARVCVVSATFDEVEQKESVRAVWVQDLALTHMEKMFLADIHTQIDFDAKTPCYKFHNRFCGLNCACTDFSSFDASVPAWLIKQAFSIIRAYLDFSQYRERGVPYSKHSLENCWNLIVSNFLYTKFKLNKYPTKIFRKYHGIPSGSAFTHIIGCICTMLLMNYLAYTANIVVSDALAHGDDGYIHTDTIIDSSVEHVLIENAKRLGFKLKISKKAPNGCTVYTKAFCDRGKRNLYPGLWISNILNCLKDIRYWDMLIESLVKTFSLTDTQTTQLLSLYIGDLPDLDVPNWFKYQLGKM